MLTTEALLSGSQSRPAKQTPSGMRLTGGGALIVDAKAQAKQAALSRRRASIGFVDLSMVG